MEEERKIEKSMADGYSKEEVRTLMDSGYCCPEDYSLNPRGIFCYNKSNCYIGANEKYYVYGNRYYYCDKCFNYPIEYTITLRPDDLENPNGILRKDHFLLGKNIMTRCAPLIRCTKCSKINHEVCTLYADRIWRHPGYICDACLLTSNACRPVNQSTAYRITETALSKHIQRRVLRFLYQNEISAIIKIRVISDVLKYVDISRSIRARFKEMGVKIPHIQYRSKLILTFQVIDNVEVCIFAIFTQEYGLDCPYPPNRGKVYIDAVDSVKFFTAPSKRTLLYHEIILGYFSHLKREGYLTIHIWNCAQMQGVSDVFYERPTYQKNPGSNQLKSWYKVLLAKGHMEGIVLGYRLRIEESENAMLKFPFFEGDFFLQSIEQSIYTCETEPIRLRGYIGTLKAKFFENYCKFNRTYNYFSIFLNTSIPPKRRGLPDPTPLINSNIADNALSFNMTFNLQCLQFSTLRDAKYATMVMLYELHKTGDDFYFYECNTCNVKVQTRLCWPQPERFNKCFSCDLASREFPFEQQDAAEINRPPVDMSKLHLLLRQPILNHKRIIMVSRMICHSFTCSLDVCALKWCENMKVSLFCTCRQKKDGGCKKCRPVMAICFDHSKRCDVLRCAMPFCDDRRIDYAKVKEGDMMRKQRNLMEERTFQIKSTLTMIRIHRGRVIRW